MESLLDTSTDSDPLLDVGGLENFPSQENLNNVEEADAEPSVEGSNGCIEEEDQALKCKVEVSGLQENLKDIVEDVKEDTVEDINQNIGENRLENHVDDNECPEDVEENYVEDELVEENDVGDSKADESHLNDSLAENSLLEGDSVENEVIDNVHDENELLEEEDEATLDSVQIEEEKVEDESEIADETSHEVNSSGEHLETNASTEEDKTLEQSIDVSAGGDLPAENASEEKADESVEAECAETGDDSVVPEESSSVKADATSEEEKEEDKLLGLDENGEEEGPTQEDYDEDAMLDCGDDDFLNQDDYCELDVNLDEDPIIDEEDEEESQTEEPQVEEDEPSSNEAEAETNGGAKPDDSSDKEDNEDDKDEENDDDKDKQEQEEEAAKDESGPAKEEEESDEESEEEDEDDDNSRDRFKSERGSTIISLSSSRTMDIPDKLEISKEDEAKIGQFMDRKGRRGGMRGGANQKFMGGHPRPLMGRMPFPPQRGVSPLMQPGLFPLPSQADMMHSVLMHNPIPQGPLGSHSMMGGNRYGLPGNMGPWDYPGQQMHLHPPQQHFAQRQPHPHMPTSMGGFRQQQHQPRMPRSAAPPTPQKHSTSTPQSSQPQPISVVSSQSRPASANITLVGQSAEPSTPSPQSDQRLADRAKRFSEQAPKRPSDEAAEGATPSKNRKTDDEAPVDVDEEYKRKVREQQEMRRKLLQQKEMRRKQEAEPKRKELEKKLADQAGQSIKSLASGPSSTQNNRPHQPTQPMRPSQPQPPRQSIPTQIRPHQSFPPRPPMHHQGPGQFPPHRPQPPRQQYPPPPQQQYPQQPYPQQQYPSYQNQGPSPRPGTVPVRSTRQLQTLTPTHGSPSQGPQYFRDNMVSRGMGQARGNNRVIRQIDMLPEGAMPPQQEQSYQQQPILQQQGRRVVQNRKPGHHDRTVLMNPQMGVEAQGLNPQGATKALVQNLSATTSMRTISQMARSCGNFTGISNLHGAHRHGPSKQCIVMFNDPNSTAEFVSKFHRHMVDMSVISVSYCFN